MHLAMLEVSVNKDWRQPSHGLLQDWSAKPGSLSLSTRSANTFGTFKSRLKTELFM